MPDKKQNDQRAEEQQNKAGKSVLVEDQSSFIDEGSRAGKQFGNALAPRGRPRHGAVTSTYGAMLSPMLASLG